MTTRLDPEQLHHGPYHAPALRRGDRATRLYRHADVIVTSKGKRLAGSPLNRPTPVRGIRRYTIERRTPLRPRWVGW
jgi:hypothetical protein